MRPPLFAGSRPAPHVRASMREKQAQTQRSGEGRSMVRAHVAGKLVRSLSDTPFDALGPQMRSHNRLRSDRLQWTFLITNGKSAPVGAAECSVCRSFWTLPGPSQEHAIELSKETLRNNIGPVREQNPRLLSNSPAKRCTSTGKCHSSGQFVACMNAHGQSGGLPLLPRVPIAGWQACLNGAAQTPTFAVILGIGHVQQFGTSCKSGKAVENPLSKAYVNLLHSTKDFAHAPA